MSTLFYEPGEKARGQKVCIATTSYDNPDVSYTYSIQKSREALHKSGIQTEYMLNHANCHVDDSRNQVVQEFLLSDCTDLVFIDSDVSWDPEQLVRLCKHDADLVGGVYPFRSQDPGREMPVRMLDGVFKPDENGLIEVEGLPTGFMRIRRSVLEKMAEHAKKYWHRSDTRSQVPLLFERVYEDGTRWGGDLNFCRKWRQMGGKVFADYEMRLGHTCKFVVRESLGSALRKKSGITLKVICDLIREGKEESYHYSEAVSFAGNQPFTAKEDVLMSAVSMARKADGPIIEAGSGLSTVLMAAANPDQIVYCMEHSKLYAQLLRDMVGQAGLKNVGLCVCPLRDGWYDLDGMELPNHFSLGLVDGPPRYLGSDRMRFLNVFDGLVDNLVVDDVDQTDYRHTLEKWASECGKQVDYVEKVAIIRPQKVCA